MGEGADNICFFRIISLFNNIAKFPSKAFAARLSPIVHKLISAMQTTFIKEKFIMDGILVLHESSYRIFMLMGMKWWFLIST